MKKILITVLAFSLALVMTACGGASSFGVESTDGSVVATAENAAAESSAVGYITLEKDTEVTVAATLEKGTVEVLVVPLEKVIEADENVLSDEDADPEELIEAINGTEGTLVSADDAVLACYEMKGGESSTGGLVKGDYAVVVTVLEDGTDGTVTVTQAE